MSSTGESRAEPSQLPARLASCDASVDVVSRDAVRELGSDASSPARPVSPETAPQKRACSASEGRLDAAGEAGRARQGSDDLDAGHRNELYEKIYERSPDENARRSRGQPPRKKRRRKRRPKEL